MGTLEKSGRRAGGNSPFGFRGNVRCPTREEVMPIEVVLTIALLVILIETIKHR